MMESTPQRREFLHQFGLGGIALTWMLHQERGLRAESPPKPRATPTPTPTGLHFPAKAKRVIQIFSPGGVSHLDTFDYKPDLKKYEGQPLPSDRKIETFFNRPGRLMPTPFRFAQHGQSGRWVSELFPELAKHVDRLTFIQNMQAKSSNHTPAAFQMNSGTLFNGFPCMGAWLSYGLGTMNADLPTFLVMPDPRGLPAGGAVNWTSGFLPAQHQGVTLRNGPEAVRNLQTPPQVNPQERTDSLAMFRTLEEGFAATLPGDDALRARLRSYELAARMQMRIPEVTSIDSEPERIRRMYGLERPETRGFGRNCLLARRFLEKGVRFVQLWHGGAFGSPRINWDAHEDIVDNHRTQAASLDQPVAALLTDLQERGMLDDTLVLWTTEFGRTPITEGIGRPGRDHHPTVFTIWMAGAGLKPGTVYGASDDLGFGPQDDEATTIYDFHATVLHLLGIDHTKLTYYHNGIRRRLTDVHGEVIEDILA
ncbi:DUF1501 domain-containing protein [Tuwongella immobilis]|uniref:Uncharacterized protein n=1 Tax=Tuwongella immobilis TaxID=692036 RepID=A0A6C2YKA1_9BACT|nr:DUF1501 domain-containing protein [Tuwongella immobilis]VIP01535.1 arylsulfatase a family protein : Uncharacterized protein OS=Planctomyces maris DSM 8797 GN=PM8797T_06877 PE=4 SV=1: DUF1501 [Tuwongella immobilis]VTR98697.1 arylsulfatase a family protein : Uncharacterized protein OS=Planctomyces maris DSM 8797 GN=PM8797T_06877 PE=4 SV=1: DUF1501 [Tuwongella immobilis]